MRLARILPIRGLMNPLAQSTSTAPAFPTPTSVSRIAAIESRMATPMSTHAIPTLASPDGRSVHVVHLVAELAPFARSGGLGEAVASLARFQVASGVPTAIISA